jgi:hypothetical protein
MRLITTIGVDVIRRYRPAASRLYGSGPEPSTFKLLTITLIALGFARRRQSAVQSPRGAPTRLDQG